MADRKPKVPLMAALCSSAFPGLGHLYAGLGRHGLAIVFLFIAALIVAAEVLQHPQARTSFFILSVTLIMVMEIYVLMDSYQRARRFNQRHKLSIAPMTFWQKGGLAAGIVLIFLFTNFISKWMFPFVLYKMNRISAFKIRGTLAPLQDNDIVLVDKAAYRKDFPQRGDIVVFHYPLDQRRQLVKRVIGVPGDTVEIREGKVFVNQNLVEDPLVYSIYHSLDIPPGKDPQSVVVSPGCLYVLDDKSVSKYDSRALGDIARKFIVGKVYKIRTPVSHSGPV